MNANVWPAFQPFLPTALERAHRVISGAKQKTLPFRVVRSINNAEVTTTSSFYSDLINYLPYAGFGGGSGEPLLRFESQLILYAIHSSGLANHMGLEPNRAINFSSLLVADLVNTVHQSINRMLRSGECKAARDRRTRHITRTNKFLNLLSDQRRPIVVVRTTLFLNTNLANSTSGCREQFSGVWDPFLQSLYSDTRSSKPLGHWALLRTPPNGLVAMVFYAFVSPEFDLTYFSSLLVSLWGKHTESRGAINIAHPSQQNPHGFEFWGSFAYLKNIIKTMMTHQILDEWLPESEGAEFPMLSIQFGTSDAKRRGENSSTRSGGGK
ncbi:MAG: hypothetical protein EKK46_10880 [Rhodocyclaceae bacterium]|nr:MAG: hypothetical protein EKK46_10880 [Rhodocyclaceae bacterium]